MLDNSKDKLDLVSFKGNIHKTKFTTEFTEVYNFASGFQFIVKDYLPSRHKVRSIGRLLGFNQKEFITFSDANIGRRDNPKIYAVSENTKLIKLEGLFRNLNSVLEAVEKDKYNLALYGIDASIRDLGLSKFQMLSRKSWYKIHYKIILCVVDMLCFLKLRHSFYLLSICVHYS